MSKKNVILILIALAVIFGGGYFAFYKLQGIKGISQIIIKSAASRLATPLPEKNALEMALGFTSPKNYLILFLNNTELRPGGGFIGAYAVVRFDKGLPEIIKVEGTEILDNYAPQDFPSVPPDAMKKYLGTARFNFRDSNWRPDFASSSRASLALYEKEKGVLAGQIDGVIGFTPTVVEELLKITGPIKTGGMTFNSQNFTEQLEYEVEYGYKSKGQDFNSRKKVMSDLMHIFSNKLRGDLLNNWRNYYALAERMFREKHIVLYAVDSNAQIILANKNWAGLMLENPGDYLFWVDANLGALKTDVIMERSLSYKVSPTSTGYVATVAMDYKNNGSFTWRTTRYRTYTRVYAPIGSVLVKTEGSMDKDKSKNPGQIDEGIEGGRQWFGAFISIEPGKTGTLSFSYLLPKQITEQINLGKYNLLVQKQIGSLANKLTLELDFGKNVVSASPAEDSSKFGDMRYEYAADLSVDREFSVKLDSN